jgi:uroporphyrinogen-III decarboxylase
MELSDGERFIRCVLGQKVDRLPYGVGIGWRGWAATLARWREETGQSELSLDAELGYDARDAMPEHNQGIFPEFEEIVIEETEEYVVSRNNRGIKMRNRRDLGSMPEFLDYPVKTREDWERLKAERLDPDTPGRITENWNLFRSRVAVTGEAVLAGEYPHGVFGAPRELMGAEELLISFYTDPALVKDMMNHLTTLWISIWARFANEVQIDRIHIWEDMSGRQGSLISPKMVNEFMMPCYDRIAAFAKEAGVRVISVDTDGDCSELVPIFMAHGVNLVYPFEVQAGNDIREYRRKYPKLGILGGLDKRALASGKAAIDKEVGLAREMAKDGRYVPGYDHLIPPDVSWENFAYSCGRLRQLCFETKPGK